MGSDPMEAGRTRPRHQNHPRPLPSRQPTAAKVQTGTECRALSAKTISRHATGRATDEPTDQPSQNRRVESHLSNNTPHQSFQSVTSNRGQSTSGNCTLNMWRNVPRRRRTAFPGNAPPSARRFAACDCQLVSVAQTALRADAFVPPSCGDPTPRPSAGPDAAAPRRTRGIS